jgi:hypothetical protein
MIAKGLLKVCLNVGRGVSAIMLEGNYDAWRCMAEKQRRQQNFNETGL